LAENKMITQLKKVKLPFSLGIFQQIAGEVLMKHADQISQFVETIIIEREILFSKLKEIPGICPIPSQANFILFEIKKKSAEEVFLSLLKQGVLVRYFGSRELENMLRVTVGSPYENRLFLKELEKVM
jgi:histidinol-phosphate aminotransferase